MRYISTILRNLVYIIGMIAATSGSTISATNLVDLLIIGGGASGVSAGLQASRMGTTTLIVEEGPWVGGMLTSAGVSAIDGNKKLPAGVFGEFVNALAEHYGSKQSLATGWVSDIMFEPSVGNNILRSFIAREKNLQLMTNTSLVSLTKNQKGWHVVLKDKIGDQFDIDTKLLIDATELGDVAKMAGVKYDIGMESNKITKEDIAPLIANNIIQDLTYVAILKDFGKDVSIARPADYDSTQYACCAVNDACFNPKEADRMWSVDKMMTYGKLPNNKYMMNWPIEGNDYYTNIIELTPEMRAQQLQKAKNFTLGYVYFIQHQLGYKNFGLADDEFPTIDNLAMIPYHRESRRIHGLVRFDLNDLCKPYDQRLPLYRTTIAVGDYPVDHHHKRYTGSEKLPNLYFQPVPSYGLPLGTIIPQDVNDLIVAEKSISVSNIVNGTTRLQPVVMQIGQASGALAALAVAQNVHVKDVKVRDVQKAILAAGGYLLPYLDVTKESPLFKPLQRIGATGILHGTGKNAGWSNQTWIYSDSILVAGDLKGLQEMYGKKVSISKSLTSPVTVGQVVKLVQTLTKANNINSKIVESNIMKLWQQFKFGKYNKNKNITRGEYAVIIDSILNPFEKNVSITGNFVD